MRLPCDSWEERTRRAFAAQRRLREVAFALLFGVLVFGLSACSAAAVLQNAASATNHAGELTTSAASVLHDKCTAPMAALAAMPDSPTKTGRGMTLDEKCGPAAIAFDALRALHIEARALMVKAQSATGVTVGDLLDMIDRLTQVAGDMELKIEKVMR